MHLFVLLTACISLGLCLGSNNTEPQGHHKRWYSIGAPPSTPGAKFTTWPTVCDDGPERWLRYCFDTDQTADLLLNTLLQAIARWSPAFQYSTLSIQPALHCAGDYRCVCQQDPEDNLVISDVAPSQLESQTTMGYSTDETKRPRNSMMFGEVYDHDMPQDMVDSAVLTMTHELGHAIGLAHEHQRPDRDDWITFHCENLEGYDEAKSKVDGHKAFRSDLTLEERVELVCDHERLAQIFFPEAYEFLPGDKVSADAGFEHGGNFDYNSIMLYSSRGASSVTNQPVIERHKYKQPGVDVSEFFMGGHEDPTKASISVGDIARVAALYPISPEKVQEAAALERWAPLRFEIPGVFAATVRQAPAGS